MLWMKQKHRIPTTGPTLHREAVETVNMVIEFVLLAQHCGLWMRRGR